MGVVNYTPRDWSATEFVTEAMMDDEVKTPWTNLQSAWTAYTPTWSASSAPALGNGTWDCAYHRWGKTVLFRISLTMGSTTTYGSGQWSISLPVNPKTDKLRFGSGLAFDSSANGWFPLASTWISSSTSNVLWTPATTAGNADRACNSTAPFTWAASDVLTLHGQYEVA